MSSSPTVYDLSEYLWLVVVGCFFGFVYAFGIGANDVANAFASTVASGSLTLKQAVLVASIFEFCGAFFLGASVTSTIRSKVISTSLYVDEPEILMLGMFTSLITATVLLLTATYFSMPVSTTHTVVGCIIGFSICAKGFSSVDWKVVKQIFISWIVSPLVSGVVSFIFFFTIRTLIMRHDNSYQRAYYLFPLVLLCGIGIDLFYILYKATTNKKNFNPTLGFTLGIAFGTGAACGLIWIFIIGPFARKRVEAEMLRRSEDAEVDGTDEQVAARTEATARKEVATRKDDGQEVFSDDVDDEEDAEPAIEKPAVDEYDVAKPAVDEYDVALEEEQPQGRFARMSQKFADMTYGQDLKTQSLHENKRAAHIWDEGEMFDPHTEYLFTYLQVFTACLNSFAHGANDVANAIAPISALVDIYQKGYVSKSSTVQKWILAYGGVGIVIGLLLYGYKVMKSLGYKMTILSPSRGACAELAASLFVVTASFLSIPVSSTQAICGAVVGVGLVGGFKNVQWWFFLRVCLSWVVVFMLACFCSAGVFSMFAFTPTLRAPIEPVS